VYKLPIEVPSMQSSAAKRTLLHFQVNTSHGITINFHSPKQMAKHNDKHRFACCIVY